jgi:trimethylamine---corrinoid protein Co-methyltransferase
MRRGTHAGGMHQGGASLSLYSQDELAAFHRATLEVLERTGLFVEDDDALDVFADGGCRVDRETHIVKIPPEVVEESIRSSSPVFGLGARDPKNDLALGGDAVLFATFMVGVSVNDLETGERRPSTVRDVSEMAVLTDALDNIDLFNVPLTAFDAPQRSTESLHSYAAALKNTTKAVFPGVVCTYLAAQGALEMASAVCGGMDAVRERHFFTGFGGGTSPLQLDAESTRIMLLGVRNGLAAGPLGTMAMSGGTAPATDAAGLVIEFSELLGCVVLAQLAERGAACCLGTSGTFMDMRFATCPVGSPEAQLRNVGMTEAARFYGMASWCGGL